MQVTDPTTGRVMPGMEQLVDQYAAIKILQVWELLRRQRCPLSCTVLTSFRRHIELCCY